MILSLNHSKTNSAIGLPLNSPGSQYQVLASLARAGALPGVCGGGKRGTLLHCLLCL